MKILFSSYLFDPSVGGLETVSKILAAEFAAAGHDVHVITQSEGNEISNANYRLSRRPSLYELIGLLRWADVFFQNNVSLRSLLPALFLRKPTVVVHQTWLEDANGRIGWHNRFKRALLPLVVNVAISKAVAERLGVASTVIGNPYDDQTFHVIPNIARDKPIAFVGRLVSDKGVDVLLRAIKLLREDQLVPDVTIIGEGPEEPKLRSLMNELQLSDQVQFAGKKTGLVLAEALNCFQILVVPSRLPEPFGVVALEGIACGCVVVGSAGGGLKDAIGPCGLTFENGNARDLADRLKHLLFGTTANVHRSASTHLDAFRPGAVAAGYLAVIREELQ